MKVSSRKEAWETVNRFFPTEYEKDEVSSQNAGYPIYKSTSSDEEYRFAQIAVSSGFYYWKAKAENLLKMPIQLLDDLPEDMRERADPNQIIASVIGMKD